MTTQQQQELDQYQAEMISAVSAYMDGDSKPFIEHCKKYSIPAVTDELVLRGSICKCVTGNASFPMEMRTRAKRWLLKNKLSSFDDGDVPV